MKNHDTSTDSNPTVHCEIHLQKFEDGTIRPKILNVGLKYYEVIGMLELIKLELAERSWDDADKIRKKKK